jgi:hypothetical protein
MNIGLKSALVATAAALAMGASAFANTITIGTTGATLTCSVSCEAYSGAGGLDIDPPPPSAVDPTGQGTLGSLAQLYNGSPADEDSEAARLATLIDGAGGIQAADLGAGSKFDPPSNPFDSGALYIVLKIGNFEIFVKNTSGGSQTYTYAGTEGLGLSHYTTFGDPIPVPAALWLMGSGLAGLGFAGRRKKA